MSELIEQLPSKEEAQVWEDNIRTGLNTARVYLLKMRDSKGYKVLGFDTFEEWGKKAIGYKSSHLYRLATAAEIQRSLNSPMGEKITERQLRPLSKVPEEERQAIWEAAKQEAIDNEEVFTAKHVQALVAEWEAKVKEEQQRVQEWRQEKLNERNEARKQAERAANLERELQAAKNKPAEVIYVDNSEKALEQYREETEAKLKDLKDQAKKAREDLQTAKIQQNAAIKSGIESELKKRSDEVERLQKQETAIVGRIDVLRTDLDALENQALHVNAIREFKQYMNGMNVALSALFDDDVVCDEDSKNRWIAEIHKAKTMLDQAELQVGSVERLI